MEEFKKFKKKMLVWHFVKTILCSLCLGLFGATFGILIGHLFIPTYTLILSLSVGLISALAGGFGFYKHRYPSDKLIALQVDKELSLNEKCATMVEFKDSSGTIINKQREDAVKTLSNKSTKALKFHLSALSVMVLALSACGFTGSLFVPETKHNHVQDTPSSLISSVGDTISSNIDDIPFSSDHDDNKEKENNLSNTIDDILNDLEKNLENTEDSEERTSMGEDAKDKINEAVDDANTKEEIGEALTHQEDEALQDLGEALKDGNNDAVNDAMNKLSEELNNTNSSEELAEKMEDIANQIEDALNEAEENGANPDDSLYQTLEKLAQDLKDQAEQIQSGDSEDSEQDLEEGQEQANESVNEAKQEMMQEVIEQNNNEKAGEQAKQKVDQMVKNGQPGDEPGDEPGDNSGNPGSGEDTGNNGNGNGNGSEDGDGNGASSGKAGEHHTDTVYTKDGETEYGDVINDYQGDAAEDADEVGDDDLTGAQGDYFNNLYGNGKGK